MLNKELHLVTNPFDEKNIEKIKTRDGYGKGLVEAGEKNPDIVVLCADVKESTRCHWFAEKFPERFIECGIAEQNMMSVAAGLAISGKIPFVSTYSVFCPGMNWSQIRVNVLQNNANVKITGAHAGISVGPDGMSHQGLEDIAIMRCLPGIVILAPCDAVETRKATLAAAQYQGAVYLRFARDKTPVFTTEKTPFAIGKSEIFKSGEDVSIVACGPILYKAMLAAKELEEEKISVEVINNHTIKPLDEETILESAQKTKALVTVEEHQVMGGMGSAVAEMLAKKFPVPVEMIGVQNRFGESGKPDELFEELGMGVSHIKDAVKKVITRK